ncbi:MAG: TIGR03808 family TAT-translocated repetitive protein, partial [Hyphomicrobiaceae bacterium]
FTRLLGSGSATILKHIGGPALLAADTAADVTVESISLEGDPSRGGGSGSLIELIGVKRVSLCDLDVRRCAGNAISLSGCSGTVTGCRIEEAGKAAIFSLDSDGGMEISRNHISRCANNGILVWKSAKGEDGTIVSTNRIEHIGARDGGSGENGNAINVFRAGGVLVTSNRIADCAYSAVRANSAPDVQIIANSVARMGEVALFVEFAFDGAVVSSNLVDRAAVGISVTNFNEGGRLATVSGNLVRNLFRRNVEVDAGGIGIAVEADTSVCGNTVEGAPVAGIRIGWGRYCRDVVATGNIVRASGIGIAVAADSRAGNVLLASNVISGSRRGAIRAMDHDRPVGEDLAIGGASQQMPRRGLRIEGNMSG